MFPVSLRFLFMYHMQNVSSSMPCSSYFAFVNNFFEILCCYESGTCRTADLIAAAPKHQCDHMLRLQLTDLL